MTKPCRDWVWCPHCKEWVPGADTKIINGKLNNDELRTHRPYCSPYQKAKNQTIEEFENRDRGF